MLNQALDFIPRVETPFEMPDVGMAALESLAGYVERALGDSQEVRRLLVRMGRDLFASLDDEPDKDRASVLSHEVTLSITFQHDVHLVDDVPSMIKAGLLKLELS